MQDISIWFIPEKKQKDSLQKTIVDLARQYEAHPFLPHITLYHLSHSSIQLSDVVKVITKTAKISYPLTLDFDGLYYSEQFAKTLFARYHISPALQSLHERLQKSFSAHLYQLVPHLSLIYKNNMNKEDKNIEQKRIHVPEKLCLDRIVIITKEGGPITKEKDVLEWRVINQFSLH